MASPRVCAALAAFASLAVPLFVRADPPQPAVAGFVFPAGSAVRLILSAPVDSGSTAPGSVVQARLAQPIVAGGRTFAAAGTEVALTVAEVRRASPGVDGALFLRVGPVRAAGGELSLELPHATLTPLLVAADPEDVVPPSPAPPVARAGGDLVLPAGTVLRATTTATLDAGDPQKFQIVGPSPFTSSADRPFAAFTAIPLATYNPPSRPPPRRRGRPTPSPAPSALPSPSPSPG